MRRNDISICILRAGGTNCDEETKRAIENCGVRAEILHTNKIIKNRRLLEYHGLVLPGGFSFGDYVRAGAIWADVIKQELLEQMMMFVDSGRPILGICNGFQVLIEAGILPGLNGFEKTPSLVLASNKPPGYRCTWTTDNSFLYLRHENAGKCVFTRQIPKGRLLRLPIAHAEGRLVLPQGKERESFEQLQKQDQIVFRFSLEDGGDANNRFPFNPNDAAYDITAICNSTGTVCGMMPHPERAFFGYQLPDWTGRKYLQAFGDGRLIFESMVDYIEEKL
ncbi:MAG: phosphoribosylformylglycinamidine synthase I [archaeon]